MPGTLTTAVAVVGAGSAVAPRHWAAFNALPDVEVVAAVDINPTVRERLSREWLVPTFPSVPELAAASKVHLGIICVPDHLHVHATRQVLAAGWDALVEKPMATSRRAAAALYRDAHRHGRYLKAALQRRYQTEAIRDLLLEGAFGTIKAVEARWWSPDPMPTWRRQLNHRGGVIADRGIHLLSQVDDFMRRSTPVRVTARAMRQSGQRVESAALVIVDYHDGATVTVTTGFDRAISAEQVALHVVAPDAELSLTLPTLEGPDAAQHDPPELCIRTDDGPITRTLDHVLTVSECHARLAEDTIAAVQHGGCASAAEQARELRLLSLIDAAYDSLDKGGSPVSVWRSHGRMWKRPRRLP